MIENDELNEELYGIPCYAEDIYPSIYRGKISKISDKRLVELVKYFMELNEESKYSLMSFMHEDFLVNLINNVEIDDISNYLINTMKYHLGKECNHEYVLCFRRAIPSEYPKTENFWSNEFGEVYNGLTPEIIGPQRLHSVINVTTLDKLEKHGIVFTGKGVSDGEIAIDPNKNFDSILFRYKPISEYYELLEFLKNGGITRKELLEELYENRYERMKKQGLPIEEPIHNSKMHI